MKRARDDEAEVKVLGELGSLDQDESSATAKVAHTAWFQTNFGGIIQAMKEGGSTYEEIRIALNQQYGEEWYSYLERLDGATTPQQVVDEVVHCYHNGTDGLWHDALNSDLLIALRRGWEDSRYQYNNTDLMFTDNRVPEHLGKVPALYQLWNNICFCASVLSHGCVDAYDYLATRGLNLADAPYQYLSAILSSLRDDATLFQRVWPLLSPLLGGPCVHDYAKKIVRPAIAEAFLTALKTEDKVHEHYTSVLLMQRNKNWCTLKYRVPMIVVLLRHGVGWAELVVDQEWSDDTHIVLLELLQGVSGVDVKALGSVLLRKVLRQGLGYHDTYQPCPKVVLERLVKLGVPVPKIKDVNYPANRHLYHWLLDHDPTQDLTGVDVWPALQNMDSIWLAEMLKAGGQVYNNEHWDVLRQGQLRYRFFEHKAARVKDQLKFIKTLIRYKVPLNAATHLGAVNHLPKAARKLVIDHHLKTDHTPAELRSTPIVLS